MHEPLLLNLVTIDNSRNLENRENFYKVKIIVVEKMSQTIRGKIFKLSINESVFPCFKYTRLSLNLIFQLRVGLGRRT